MSNMLAKIGKRVYGRISGSGYAPWRRQAAPPPPERKERWTHQLHRHPHIQAEEGEDGAAAFDRQGRFAGMAEMRNAVLASIAPALPPLRLIRTETIRAFLEEHKVPAATAQNADASKSVVRIICVRK